MNALIDVKLNATSQYVDDKVMDEFIHFMGEDGDGLAKELMELYLKNAPKMIAGIEADIQAGNMDALKAHVHGLKGSSAQLGVIGIADTCRAIENAILESEPDQIQPLFAQLQDIYQQVDIYFTNRVEEQG
jgi:HPt (histidine-containing phosphotransfer) domain-containing protein